MAVLEFVGCPAGYRHAGLLVDLSRELPGQVQCIKNIVARSFLGSQASLLFCR